MTIVGSGIRAGGQLTPESRVALEQADVVFHVLTDPVADELVREINPRGESLIRFYGSSKNRMKTYEQMVAAILAPVRRGLRSCAVYYGHPGVFAWAPHEAVRRARAEGYAARMLPGISSEDCLFADLGLDPAWDGCQTYEASDFLLARRVWDPTAALVLLQISNIGVVTYQVAPRRDRVKLLGEVLQTHYPASHEVVLYEASPLVGVEHTAHRTRLDRMHRGPITLRTTLYVPRLAPRPYDPEMLQRLGVTVPAPRRKR